MNKKLYTLIAVLLLTTITFAQAPEKISYQAVVRDATNATVAIQVVGMQISILQTTAAGTAMYVETQTPTTNANGVLSIYIGSGTAVTGTFAGIDWSAGPYFIKTEIDPTGNNGNYTITGATQLVSVPFALYAKTAGENVLKENTANKSTNVVTDAASDEKFPSVKSVKTYVDAQYTSIGALIAALETRIVALETPPTVSTTINDYEFETIDNQGDYLVREYKITNEDYFIEVYAEIDGNNVTQKIDQVVLTNNEDALVLNFNINDDLNRLFVQSVATGIVTEDYYIVKENDQYYIKDNENTIKLDYETEFLTYQLFELQDPLSIKLNSLFIKNDLSINKAFEYLKQTGSLKASLSKKTNQEKVQAQGESSSLITTILDFIRTEITEDYNNNPPKTPVETRRSTCFGVRGKSSGIKVEDPSTYRCSEVTEDERKTSSTLELKICEGGNICFVDCAGVENGTASYDDCNICVGGTTGSTPCILDCNNELGGTAYLDDCKECVGGSTGKEECVTDCIGIPGGTAYLDDCNECVGGTTGKEECVTDCMGTPGGTAYLDDCNECVGGTTGKEECVTDCIGIPGGTAYLDDCNECVGGSSGKEECVSIEEVYNPVTGRTWMDRNLGASQVGSYGDLYQWGRDTDGHEKRTSGTTTTLSSSDTPGHGNFIITSSVSPYDWRSPQNANLWHPNLGLNNPCPSGYRIPSIPEWEAERLSWSSNDAAGAYASPLKLPMAGVRGYDGLLYMRSDGFYWSNGAGGIYVGALYFNSNYASMLNNRVRANGYSVRCIKD